MTEKLSQTVALYGIILYLRIALIIEKRNYLKHCSWVLRIAKALSFQKGSMGNPLCCLVLHTTDKGSPEG